MKTHTASKSDLLQKKCIPCKGDLKPFSEDEIQDMLTQIDGWRYAEGFIARSFDFKNYYETTAFVNAVAWIAHQEDHHPDIEFEYKQCRVKFKTHAIDGLSENDFIMAAKINRLTA